MRLEQQQKADRGRRNQQIGYGRARDTSPFL